MKLSIAHVFTFALPALGNAQLVWDMNCAACDNSCRWWDLTCHFCASTADVGRSLFQSINDPCSAENIVWSDAEEQLLDSGKAKLVELGFYEQAFVDSVEIKWCKSLSDSGALGFTPNENMFWVDDSWLDESFTDLVVLLAHEFVHIEQWRGLDSDVSENEIYCTFGENGIESTLNQEFCISDLEEPACNRADAVRDCIENGNNCP